MSTPSKKQIRSKDESTVRWASEVSASEILDSLPDAVFTTDRQMRINYFNRAASVITGFRTREALGMYCKDVLKSDICETECPIKRALDSHQNIFDIETAIRTIEKTEIPILISASLLTGSSGRVVGYMHVFRDISAITKMVADLERSGDELTRRNVELDQALEELKATQRQLLQAQKMEAMGTLAGGIAHDFNNVLMGIQGHTSLLMLDTDPDHPHFEHLKGAEELVKRGAELTRQLLGFARGGKYEVVSTDLNDLISKSSEMFGRTKREIRIHTKYEEDLWPVEVDRGQIEQVLLNIYVNAWQAMPHGGDLYVETNNLLVDGHHAKSFGLKPGKYVKISAADTGIGMDRATQERVFDPFFTTKEIGRGTGLGLASAYGIVKNHGGMISVCSEKGKGATFDVYVPASEKQIKTKDVRPSRDRILTGTETVLLVDDEEAVLNVGKEFLERMNYKVFLARNGTEALKIYGEHHHEIDLVILDVIMPDLSGGEVYDVMKRNSSREFKVLLSSGYSLSGQAAEILQRGCSGFIQKPFNIKALSEKIREVLDNK